MFNYLKNNIEITALVPVREFAGTYVEKPHTFTILEFDDKYIKGQSIVDGKIFNKIHLSKVIALEGMETERYIKSKEIK